MQKIKGNFAVTFLGTPLMFVSKSVLTAEDGSIATVYSLHLTPFLAVGFTVKKRKTK